MDSRTRKLIEEFVNVNIVSFHEKRAEIIRSIKLRALLKKNPYLFRAKNINLADEYVKALLNALISSGEETFFGGFLEELAIYVAEITSGGKKSTSPGIDLDLSKGGVRYLVAIKSGGNWGNSSQQKALKRDFTEALRVLGQSKRIGVVQPILGICYGKTKTRNNGLFIKIVGQSFWNLISDDRNLYTDIVEPLGYEAEAHNKIFAEELANTTNRLVGEFVTDFCIDGKIDWPALVRYVSGNMP